MPPTTTFILDADETKAVNAVLNLVRNQGKIDRGWKSNKDIAREASKAMIDSLVSVGAGFVSLGSAVNLVKGYLDQVQSKLKESARTADEFLRIGVDAQVLLGKPGAEYRREVFDIAKAYRIAPNEIQPALANFVSSTPSLGKQQRDALFAEMAEFRKQSSLELDQLVPMFASIANIAPEYKSGQRDANWVQSVVKQAFDQSKSRPAELELNLPRVVAGGAIAGLTTEQAVGLWAQITTKSGNPTQATEGFVGMLSKIAFPAGINLDEPDKTAAPVGRIGKRGKQPESQETLQRRLLGMAGITEDVKGLDRLAMLADAYASGKITAEMAHAITGSGSDFAATMNAISDWKGAKDSIATMERMTAPGMDPTRDAVKKLQLDPVYQAQQATVSAQISLDEERMQSAVKALEQKRLDIDIQREMEGGKGSYFDKAMTRFWLWAGGGTEGVAFQENAEAIGNVGNVQANRAAMGMSTDLPSPVTRGGKVNTSSVSGALRVAAEAMNAAVLAAESSEGRSGRSAREAVRRTQR